MRRQILIVLAMAFTVAVMAQSRAQADLNAKASKAARKDAKSLVKDGWQVSPGALPLEKQLDRAYNFQLDVDDDMNPKYFIGEGRSIGENYDAAKMQAMEVAREQLAGQIGSEATALVDNLTANKQLAGEQAASISTLMAKGKTIFSKKLGRVQVVTEAYRVLPNKNKEVLIRLVAKEADIQNVAKGAIREELERQGMQMNDELKALLNVVK